MDGARVAPISAESLVGMIVRARIETRMLTIRSSTTAPRRRIALRGDRLGRALATPALGIESFPLTGSNLGSAINVFVRCGGQPGIDFSNLRIPAQLGCSGSVSFVIIAFLEEL